MPRKLFVGVFLAATVAISAGEFLFNYSGAQDAPKKDDKRSDDKLFDILKKDLETKVPPADLKSLEIPPPVVPMLKPGELPALPGLSVTAQPVTPPPAPPELPKAPTLPVVKDEKTPSIPPPMETEKPKVEFPPAPKLVEPVKPKADVLEFPSLPDAKAPPTTALPQPAIKPVHEPAVKPEAPLTIPPVDNSKGGTIIVPPSTPFAPPAVQISPMQPIMAEVNKLKNCPWSMHVEMVDGQTVVTATVNKRHEFKIFCQSLDLQTGKGTLKASGKVQISGDMLTGNCEHLGIALMEDRLVLEGGAAVSIQKLSTNVSDVKPAAFELKGDKLDLRISELDGGKFQQTSWQKVTVDTNVKQASAMSPSITDKRWTAYGKLIRNETKLGADWRLVKSNGEVIAYLMAREGGTLERFAGQTISVFGTPEELHGTSVLRVTHIALP